MTRAQRAFQVGGWVALAAAVVTAAIAVTVAVTGALALTGKVTYPVDYNLGPLHYQDTISTQVQAGEDVCETSRVGSHTPSCNSYFIHDEDSWTQNANVRRQDADIQPAFVHLVGEVHLTSTGGWSPYVAAQVVKKVVVGTTVTMWCVLLWRLLVAAATGNPFNTRTVRYLRALGWLAIAGAALAPALSHFTDLYQVGYSAESFNEEMLLQPWSRHDGYPDGINFVQVALGGLVLLVAEVFRHGATIETEQRLTV